MDALFEISPAKLYTTAAAARKLELAPKTLRYKIRMGYIRAYNINKDGERPDYRIQGEDLIRFISESDTYC